MTAEDDGLDIELQASTPAEEPLSVSLETGTPVGSPAGSPVVLVDAAVREWMEEYARGDTTRERGGMLLGRLAQVGDEARVTVEAAVEAVGAEERRASITFTHETWAHINAVKEERYPHLRIVGWFHTHPGYGVFLSGYDLFIHRNFFNLPWQVAFVLDPIRGDTGFFGWRAGDVDRLPGYYLRGAAPVTARPAAPAPQEVRVAVARRRVPVLVGGAVGVAAAVLMALLWPRPPQSGTGVSPVPPGRSKKTPPVAVPVAPPVGEKKEAPGVRSYVQMHEGDTLWELSRSYLGDPRRYREVQDFNGIADPKRIAKGTIVAIPASEGKGPQSLLKGDARNGKSERDGDRRHRQQGTAGGPAR